MDSKNQSTIQVIIFALGLAALVVSIYWFYSGEIVMRNGDDHGSGEVTGVIERGSAMFYPLTTAWILVGLTMCSASLVALGTSHPTSVKVSGYSALGILVVGLATAITAMSIGT